VQVFVIKFICDLSPFFEGIVQTLRTYGPVITFFVKVVEVVIIIVCSFLIDLMELISSYFREFPPNYIPYQFTPQSVKTALIIALTNLLDFCGMICFRTFLIFCEIAEIIWEIILEIIKKIGGS